jgi:hypothetical protein
VEKIIPYNLFPLSIKKEEEEEEERKRKKER